MPQNSVLNILRTLDFGLLSKRHITEAVREVYDLNREAKYAGWYEFTRPVVLVRDPELIKAITIKDFEHFTDHRGFDFDELEVLFSKSLFSLRGEKWKNMRHLLSPAFTSSKMKSMFVLMSECSKNFADIICKQARDGNSVVDLRDAFRRYTTDVIATCAYGVSVNSMKDKDNEFYVRGVESANFGKLIIVRAIIIMLFPRLARLFNIKMFGTKIELFFRDVVKTTIAARKEKGIIRPDLIQLLMESNAKQEELSIEDMTSQAFIFFLGGFSTSAVLMCFLAHLLAVNPDIQKRLQQEVDEVMKETQGEPTYDAINKMKYMEAVVNETLRLYPPMIQTDRLCTKRYELPPALPDSEPIQLNPGSLLLIPIYSLHRDPTHFKNPEVFDPNRFLGDNKLNVSPVYMPFGLGPRMCIGNRFVLLESKTVIFQLLARCNFERCEKTQDPIVLDATIDLIPKNGFWIKIVPRNS